MKMNWRPLGLACRVLVTLVWSGGFVQAAPGPAVPKVLVSAAVRDHSVRLEVTSSGPLHYAAYRTSPSLFVVDLTGSAPEASEMARVLRSDLVSSYRIRQIEKDGAPTVRLEVLLRTPVQPRVNRQGPERLVLIFTQSAATAREPALPTGASARPVVVKLSPAAGTAKAIERVELSRTDEQAQVFIQGNGHLSYHAMRLRNPERLVLDFSGARLAVAQKTISSHVPPVSEIRLGQFREDTARVVIELAKQVSYRIDEHGDTIRVIFGASAPRSAVARKENADRAKPAPVVAGQPLPVRQEASGERLPLPQTLTQPGAALASPAPAQQPQPEPQPAPADQQSPPAPAPQQEPAPAPPATEPEPAPPVPPQQAPAPAPAPAPTPAPTPSQAPAPAQLPTKYSGEPISVNLKDVDLKDFFRLIHEISGLNVVVDPSVKGTLTIVLDDVPWDQALDIVLKNNGLDKQLEGNVLRIATRDTLKKEAEELRDLAKAQAEAADTITTTRVLSYAKATDMRDTLKRFLSSRGDILADTRSNTLVIRDIPTVLPVLDNLIRQLDRKSQQVEIQARLVSATRSFAREIGTQFAFAVAGATNNPHNIVGGALGPSPVSRAIGPGLPIPPLVFGGPLAAGAASATMPLVTNLPAAVPTSGVTFLHTEPNLALDFILTAAETKGVGRILSKPKVVTQNNEKAVVKQGTKIPVQTIINNTISVQFIDAVLKLEVTPQITAEGTVFMEVLVENTAIDPAIPRIQQIPALDTQSAETKVLITDGGTVVIGGIIISSQRTDISQVPLFGSIPVIGHLFKRTKVDTTAQELLIFLTPRILPS